MIKEWFQSRLSFMLVKYILLTSIFFTFISTLIQVYIDYSTNMKEIHKTIKQIEYTYANSIANSLWHLDNDQVEVQLSGILKIRDVEYIQIYENKQSGKSIFMEMGNKNINRKLTRSFLLKHGKSNKNSIGEVYLTINLDHLYDRMIGKVFIILSSQTIQTFIVSFFILFIIYISIAKKIVTISKYAKDLTYKNIDNELLIQKGPIDEENEIDGLIDSLNKMRLNLKNYIKNRDEADQQLKNYKSHLEDLVLKRTKQLNDKNSVLEQKIHEINKMQDQLIAQEKLASLGNLTSGIAHEINNPLNFIINFSQVTCDSVEDFYHNVKSDTNYLANNRDEVLEEIEDLKSMSKEILIHGKRAEQIVKSMLEHSRAGSQDSQIQEKEATDIHALLEENLNFAFHAMRAKYRGFNINFAKEYDSTNPKINVVKGDMARVFLNLFSNAFYSMIKMNERQDNEYIPELKITTTANNSIFNIVIEDNGLGLSKEDTERIFNPFYTTKPTGEGTGLGLSLSYDIITGIHGGQLKAEGEKGKFARFTISIPV